MNKKIRLSMLSAAALLLLATATIVGADVGAFNLYRDTSDIDRIRYDVMAESVFEGTVTSREGVIEGFVYFPLKTANQMMEVQLGPEGFVKKSGFKLKMGEIVTVFGVPATLGEREVLLAREVRSMTAILIIRDRNGEPMWDLDRPVQMDTEFNESFMCELMEK